MTFGINNYADLQNAVQEFNSAGQENRDIIFQTEGGFQRFRLGDKGIEYIHTDERGLELQ